jgi:hypothetical protein
VIYSKQPDLSAFVIKGILPLDFSASKRARMTAPAGKNRDSKLTTNEEHALASYMRVGRLWGFCIRKLPVHDVLLGMDGYASTDET